MQEEKGRAESVTPTKEDAEKDATSKETVGDVKESNQASSSKAGAGSSSDGAESSAAPSPDGQFDSPREGAGEDPGPM
jgi:hypothetical protein